MSKIRVLVVDDSAVIRRLLKGALESDPDLEVVAVAVNGRDAIRLLPEAQPDAVLCDVEMPEMDGIATVQTLRRTHPRLPVVMFSSPTIEGARTTLDALHAGANDFVTKPSVTAGTALAEVMAQLRTDLGAKIKALCRGPGDLSGVARRAVFSRTSDEVALAPAPAPPVAEPTKPMPVAPQTSPLRERKDSSSPSVRPAPSRPVAPPVRPLAPRPLPESGQSGVRRAMRAGRIEAVVIGVSTGGPNALAEVIPKLPPDLGVPVLIVQHMPPLFTKLLAERLASKGRLPVREATHGDVVVAGEAYLAPGDYHLAVRRDGTQIRCVLNREPPENSVRPAADVLFRSAGEVWGGNVLVVIMTGMGQDGLLGAMHLRERGAQVIIQDEATSVVWGMPGAVAKAKIYDKMLPLGQMADEITQRVRGMR